MVPIKGKQRVFDKFCQLMMGIAEPDAYIGFVWYPVVILKLCFTVLWGFGGGAEFTVAGMRSLLEAADYLAAPGG